MNQNQTPRTYTLDQAAQELHLSRETIEEVLPQLAGGSHRAGDRLTEEQLNEIVDLLNNDPTRSAKG
jgi:hypothetical protein